MVRETLERFLADHVASHSDGDWAEIEVAEHVDRNRFGVTVGASIFELVVLQIRYSAESDPVADALRTILSEHSRITVQELRDELNLDDALRPYVKARTDRVLGRMLADLGWAKKRGARSYYYTPEGRP